MEIDDKNFMNDAVFIENETAQRLYAAAKDLPIFDFHCHLSPKEIAEDKKFFNLTELWLESDHYKWRVMRNFGIDERLITGNAPPYEKFAAFASALPSLLGNPVYHWAHLELKKYFGITTPLSACTANEIWNKTSAAMADGCFSAKKLIEKSNVNTIITTDDPTDNLEYHKSLARAGGSFKVLPSFRADNILNVEKADFSDYIGKLSEVSKTAVTDFDTLIRAVENRLIYFKSQRAVSADCSFENFPATDGRLNVNNIFKKALGGSSLSFEEAQTYRFGALKALGKLYKKHGFVMQLHTGVMRNCNSVRYRLSGADCGCDCASGPINVSAAQALFDAIESGGGMPKTVVYTLDPSSYYPLTTLLGCFAGGSRGKTQLGAAWWFLDNKDGIKEVLSVISATGGLGTFNGMLTDSRSFTSYARHDYFRRILCSFIGKLAEAGEYPSDDEDLNKLVYDVCYGNAAAYFGEREKK